MNRPRVTSIASAALSSAAAFFVLTRSGLAGTLAGAAVASMVYTGTSHWAGQGLERIARWWIARRGSATAAEVSMIALAEAVVRSEAQAEVEAQPTGATTPGREPSLAQLRPRTLGRLARTYGPVALAVVALAVSGYSLITGSPLERVIIREFVVEKPVVQEHVVVQKETVTVTVTVPVSPEQRTATTVVPSSTSSTSTTVATTTSATTTTSSVSTTTSVPPPSTSTTRAPRSTTTVLPASTTTTAAPAAGN